MSERCQPSGQTERSDLLPYPTPIAQPCPRPETGSMIHNRYLSGQVLGLGAVLAGAIVSPSLATAAAPPLIDQPPPATPPTASDRLSKPQPSSKTPSPVGQPDTISQTLANPTEVAIVPPRTLPPAITVPPPNWRTRPTSIQQPAPANSEARSQTAAREKPAPVQSSSNPGRQPRVIAQPETQPQTLINRGASSMASVARRSNQTSPDLLPVPDVPLPAISRDKPPTRRESTSSEAQPAIITQPNLAQPAPDQRAEPVRTSSNLPQQPQSSQPKPAVNSSSPATPQPTQASDREVAIARQSIPQPSTTQVLVDFLPQNPQTRTNTQPASQLDSTIPQPILQTVPVSRSPSPSSQPPTPSQPKPPLANTRPLPQASPRVRSVTTQPTTPPAIAPSPRQTAAATLPAVEPSKPTNQNRIGNFSNSELLTVPIEVAPDYPLPASVPSNIKSGVHPSRI